MNAKISAPETEPDEVYVCQLNYKNPMPVMFQRPFVYKDERSQREHQTRPGHQKMWRFWIAYGCKQRKLETKLATRQTDFEQATFKVVIITKVSNPSNGSLGNLSTEECTRQPARARPTITDCDCDLNHPV